MKRIFPILLTLSAHLAFGSDVVVFKNGDVLSGDVVRKGENRIEFRSPVLGLLDLAMEDVKEVRIAPEAAEAATVRIALDAAPKPTEKSRPKQDPETTDGKAFAQKPQKSRWSGKVGASIAMRQSNTLRRYDDSLKEKAEKYTTYRAYGDFRWKGEENQLKWNWVYRYSRSDLRKIDDYFHAGQDYRHDFTKRYYSSTKTMYQRDYRRGLENEFLQTAEMGIRWYDNPKLKLSTSIGAGYHLYERMNYDDTTSEGKFVFVQDFRWQLIESLAFFEKYSHLGSLSNYHFVFNTGLENKIVRNTFLRFEYRLDRDTDINYNDSSYYDKVLLTSLLYKF